VTTADDQDTLGSLSEDVMAETITLYGFGDSDRSGKVRWLAEELGLGVVEERVEFTRHLAPPYTDLNPLGQVPTVRWRDRVLIESTAILHVLAEAHDEPKLWIGRGERGREDYLTWLATFAETLEGRLVECAVSRIGLLGPEYFALHEAVLRRKLGVVAERLPRDGFLAGRFTLADVVAGYNLRLAVQTGLLPRDAADPYLGRLVDRPAAQRARIFASLS
jgi:glutathione S-transferase